MARVIAIVNQKGGVGKTTTAVNLAASLGASERQTLLIDIDPQANATSGMGFEAQGEQTSIYEILVDRAAAEQGVMKTEIPFLDLIPSHINLVGAELELIETEHRESILKSAIVPLRERYEYVIIDCPPSLGLLTVNALTAADSILVPVQCEYYALEGLGKLLNTITLVRKQLNKTLEIEGVLLTMFDSRLRLSKQVTDEVKKYFGDKVFESVIYRNVRLSEAPSFGKPVLLYDALSVGTQNYIMLAQELLRNHGKGNGSLPVAPLPAGTETPLRHSDEG